MLRRFAVYGLLGWVVEVLFTGSWSAASGDANATAKSYLWMHPIYGAGGLLLESVSRRTKGLPLPVRAGLYAGLMYAVEYGTGALLRRALGRCPWDYGCNGLNLHGLVRLDYAPAWLALGLLFEPARDVVERIDGALTTAVRHALPESSDVRPTLKVISPPEAEVAVAV
jgi:uncharacterized membrane protein